MHKKLAKIRREVPEICSRTDKHTHKHTHDTETSVVNKDLTFKAKAKDLTHKAKVKAKDLTFMAKAKDSKFVLEDTSRPRTKAKDNNTDRNTHTQTDKLITILRSQWRNY